MNRLYLQGYLVTDEEMIDKKENDEKFKYFINIIDIANEIMKFAKKYGYYRDYYDNDAGGTVGMISNAKIYIYITDEKSSYEEATLHLLEELYGNVYNNIKNIGYSEDTITGFKIKGLSIIGIDEQYDLVKELKSHMGEYVHFVLEC